MFLRSTYLCIRIQFIYEIFAQKHSPVSFIWFCMVINTSLWYSICCYFFSTFTYEPQGKIRVLFGSEDQSPFCRRGRTLPWRCWRFSVWTGKLGLCVQMAGCWPSPSNQQQVGRGAESEAGLWLPVVPFPAFPWCQGTSLVLRVWIQKAAVVEIHLLYWGSANHLTKAAEWGGVITPVIFYFLFP